MSECMRVKDLYQDCRTLIANGQGDKRIYISRDDEGNGFHALYYSFTTDKDEIEMSLTFGGDYVDADDQGEIVLLG